MEDDLKLIAPHVNRLLSCEEDMEKYGDQIEWLPVGSATLIEKREVITDGSQTETD